MSDKSIGLGAMIAALSMSMTHHRMHLHSWNPSYIYKKSNRLDKAAAKRSMTTKERVEARKNRDRPNA